MIIAKFNPDEAETFIDKFDAVRLGGSVRRYHTVFTHCDDTVASHSWGVATLVDIMYDGKAPAHVLRAALYHDIAEFHVGDIPSPTKRLLRSEELRKMEDLYMKDRGLFTELDEEERLVLKLADVIEGLCFCSEELGRGNRGVIPIWNRYREYAQESLLAFGRLAEKYADEADETGADASVDRAIRISEMVAHLLGCIQARMEINTR